MKNSIHLLGTGGSLGIPVVTCTCDVCHSTLIKNHRLRCSALLKIGGKQILIDPGPDIRIQCLRAGIRHLDGVILTHAHHDHCGGVDELRVFPFFHEGRLPFLLSEFSYHELKVRFHYLYDKFRFVKLNDEKGEILFEEIPIRYFTYIQQKVPVLGLRFGSMAYVTDIKHYGNEILKELQGLDVLILSALKKETGNHAHLSIQEAVEFAQKIHPKKTYLIHMSHEVDHDIINQELPKNIELAYDGLEIPL